jgi:hypothetical protein
MEQGMDGPSLAIDKLNLRLPHGFANRADAIVRQVGRELARWPITGDAQVPQLQLPKIMVNGGESNQAIARRIAQEIHSQMNNTSLKQGQSHGVV